MRLQVAHPEQHEQIVDLPFREPLDSWDMSNVHRVLGLHRHVVKLLEFGQVSYVVKEIPDHLAEREYRLLRWLADTDLPTAGASNQLCELPSPGPGTLLQPPRAAPQRATSASARRMVSSGS